MFEPLLWVRFGLLSFSDGAQGEVDTENAAGVFKCHFVPEMCLKIPVAIFQGKVPLLQLAMGLRYQRMVGPLFK